MGVLDVTLTSEPFRDAVVLAAYGDEALHEVPTYRLRVEVSEEPDLRAALRKPATLVIVDPDEGTQREVATIVTHASVETWFGNRTVVELVLSSPLWLLTQKRDTRIFQDETTLEIVEAVIRELVPAMRIEPRLGGAYVRWPQRVQYGEDSWSFITRLLADDGIALWVDTLEGAPAVIFGDAIASHAPIPALTHDGSMPSLPFVGPDADRSGSRRGFVALEREARIAPNAVHVRDFDLAQPDVYIEGVAGEGALLHFEYPARVPDNAAAEARAARRLEQLRRESLLVRGVADALRVWPGRRLAITGDAAIFSALPMLAGEVIVSRSRFAYERPTRSRDGVPFRCEVELVPTKDDDGNDRFPHRPAIVAPVRVDAFESAVTTGPAGEEIHVDFYGRVKLQFLWDRSGTTDDTSSYWARCLQLPISAPMFLPRVGWEVLVGYIDGVPDHPFVLGRLYNATGVTPYAMPARSATTALQSRSSPGGAQLHEIRLSDDAGSEEFWVHASRDQSESVGNDASTTVAVDDEHAVGLSHTATVGGAHKQSVGASQSIDVGKEHHVHVDGANVEIVAAAELINVKGNAQVTANGTYLEVVGAAHGLQCNQSNTSTTGTFVRIVGGATTLTSGLGFGESVAGGRIYHCGGSRVINTAKDYTENVTGLLGSMCGASTITAGAKHTTDASAASNKSGPLSITAGGKISISAPRVVIECASLSAGPLLIAAGAVNALGGVTEVTGTTTRQRGGKIAL